LKDLKFDDTIPDFTPSVQNPDSLRLMRGEPEAFVAEAAQSGRLSPKTINHALALLKQLLTAATDWGYLAASPIGKVRKLRLPRRPLPLWTPAEIRRFLLSAPEEWRPVWLVGIFTGLRPGEIQAMAWRDQNWPDFTSNRIHVTMSYEARSRVLGAPKTDRSVRDVDMVPTVRRILETLPGCGSAGLVFPGVHGGMFPRSPWRRAWDRTILAAKVRRIRPYDLRHTFASLLIAAGKNPPLHRPAAGALLGRLHARHLRAPDESPAPPAGGVYRRASFPRGVGGCTQTALVRRSAGCNGVQSCSTV